MVLLETIHSDMLAAKSSAVNLKNNDPQRSMPQHQKHEITTAKTIFNLQDGNVDNLFKFDKIYLPDIDDLFNKSFQFGLHSRLIVQFFGMWVHSSLLMCRPSCSFWLRR